MLAARARSRHAWRVAIQSDERKLSIYRDPSVAARYDERWAGASGQRRDERTRLAVERALERVGPIETLLDAPCGAGRFSAWLAQRTPRYVGADAAFAMLGQARGKCDAPLVTADLAALPLRSESFDVALCIRLMHLVRDAERRIAFLRELARVSRRAVIVDYVQAESLKVWYARVRSAFGLRDHAPSALSREQIRAELEAAGLELAAVEALRSPPWLSDKLVVLARPRR